LPFYISAYTTLNELLAVFFIYNYSFIRRLHLADSIHSDIITLSSLLLSHLYDEKRLT